MWSVSVKSVSDPFPTLFPDSFLTALAARQIGSRPSFLTETRSEIRLIQRLKKQARAVTHFANAGDFNPLYSAPTVPLAA
jgi:hypothetical protein